MVRLITARATPLVPDRSPLLRGAAVPHDYAYFAHDADIGVAGRGPTLEAAFAAAAHAMFSI
ncbi:MAG: archease, partial [Betaproteobacteria bacterium]|nr:archease [Betaproteobacteria bacterium]